MRFSLIRIRKCLWVCDFPIDESKPFEPYKQEKDKLKPTIQKDFISENYKK